MIICTERQVLRGFIHIRRTSAEKSAINAFLGGLEMSSIWKSKSSNDKVQVSF